MSEVAIRVQGLGKRYRLGAGRERHDTMRDALAAMAGHALGRPPSLVAGEARTGGQGILWALKDVSFSVNRGDVVGVIGRNGAGKSTLLKILSRITEPTQGRAEIHGRVGSLLEVGTGFHHELTGRENIYLNGAVLGMPKSEIERRFDEIVAFAEVERFLDTPVKHYSSGMYVRLAFAVAAHLEPEILLVDEVLAVGDASFQKKCLGKMGDVARQGRTVLFVSHNMGAVNTLTQSCLYMKSGSVAELGPTRHVVEKYLVEGLEYNGGAPASIDAFRRDSIADVPVKLTRVWVEKAAGDLGEINALYSGDPFTVCMEMEAKADIHGANLTVVLKDVDGRRIAVFFSWDQEFALTFGPGNHVIALRVDALPLAPGQYFVDLGINKATGTSPYDVIVDLPVFKVVNTGQISHWLERPWGALHWTRVCWNTVEQ